MIYLGNTMTNYRQLCSELVDAYAWCVDNYMSANSHDDFLVQRAREALAELTPEGPTDPFDMVQHQLDMLAGDEEMVIYRWSDGYWSIDHTNPSNSVKLGESNGEYESTGSSLKEAVINLEAILPNHPLI